MEAESPGTTAAPGRAAAWKQWAQVAALAVVLLVISEAVWMWQTWPVRELLQPAPAVPSTGAR
jgi:hypothetical protein